MSTVKAFYVRCDRCGYTTEDLWAETAAGARRVVRDDDWTHPRAHPNTLCRIDVCPGCSKDDA